MIIFSLFSKFINWVASSLNLSLGYLLTECFPFSPSHLYLGIIGQTPNERFEKEKSTLTSVNLDLLEPYYIPTKEYKVSNESMITYKSKKYSVPTYLIGKNITVKECDSGIYIYYNTNFICSYNTCTNFRLNYKESHYKDILKQDDVILVKASHSMKLDTIVNFLKENQ